MNSIKISHVFAADYADCTDNDHLRKFVKSVAILGWYWSLDTVERHYGVIRFYELDKDIACFCRRLRGLHRLKSAKICEICGNSS